MSKIYELAEQAAEHAVVNPSEMNLESELDDVKVVIPKEFIDKFAELLVRECIHKMLDSDDGHFMNLEGWDLGGPNHNAWTRGVLDSVAVVREHFGVEE